jgi:hypothetical protein
MTTPVAYTAVIAPVREVILAGTAELGYWRERLRSEDLQPVEEEGGASLLVTAMESKFSGIPFRELTIAVRVVEGGGVFLAYAFNSSRLLGFAERKLFRTPYFYAAIDFSERAPAFIRIPADGIAAFEARMGDVASPDSRREELFEGAIYLPGDGQRPGEVFYARLEGLVDIHPFDPARDTVTIHPEPTAPIFRWLAESGFTGREWRLRGDAIHSRSKTSRRA